MRGEFAPRTTSDGRFEFMQAIDQLPVKLKTAWILFSAQGLKISEIAEIERCSVGAVKNRLFHARKKLQAELREYLEGD